MSSTGGPCDAPLPCSTTREGQENAIELSVGCDTARDGIPRATSSNEGTIVSGRYQARGDTVQDGIAHAPSSNEGNIIPDRYLSDGFEGRCRVYSSLLHFMSGTTVLMSVIYSSSSIGELSGKFDVSKVELGIKDEIYEIFEFIGMALLTFGALVPNLIYHHTQRLCRRRGLVVLGAFCLIFLQTRPETSAATRRIFQTLPDTPVGVLVGAAALVVDVLFFRYFLSHNFCMTFFPCCMKNQNEFMVNGEQCWSLWETVVKALLGTKTAIVFYTKLIGRGLVSAWHFVRTVGTLPGWLHGQSSRLRTLAKAWWQSIREDDSYHHSVWMIGALAVAGTAIIFFSLSIPLGWSGLVRKYMRYRECILEHRGVLGDLLLGAGYGDREYYYGQIFVGGVANDTAMRDFYMELANGTTAPESPPQSVGGCTWPRYVNELYSLVDTRVNGSVRNEGDSRDPIWAFEGSLTGKFVLYLDATIESSRIAVWFGFTIAAVFGIKSLLSVLARYKFLTQVLAQVLPSSSPNGRQKLNWGSIQRVLASKDSLDTRHTQCTTWEELNEQYSLSSASLFLGVWVSTAVFQLTMIGGLATWLLASLVAWHAMWGFVGGLLPLVVVYLLLLFVDWLVKISSPLLNEAVFENHQLRRPVVWAMYTLVRSLVGLAVGLLFALWRLFLLTVMTFVNFNRLDKLVLPPDLDQGHKSLFSMAMMNAMLQKSADVACSENRDSEDADGTTHGRSPMAPPTEGLGAENDVLTRGDGTPPGRNQAAESATVIGDDRARLWDSQGAENVPIFAGWGSGGGSGLPDCTV